MGWEGGVVVFCVVCGKYWGSLKMMGHLLGPP